MKKRVNHDIREAFGTDHSCMVCVSKVIAVYAGKIYWERDFESIFFNFIYTSMVSKDGYRWCKTLKR